jgi:hypothetical protein
VVQLIPTGGLALRSSYATQESAELSAEHWSTQRPHGYFEVLLDAEDGWRWP